MTLRIAVLGTTREAGLTILHDFPAVTKCSSPQVGTEKLVGMGCQWVPVPEPLSSDGIASIRRAHGCLVSLPGDVARNERTHAGLVEDFRALRSIRGWDALTGQMPVLLMLSKAEDSQSPEMVRLVRQLNYELGRDFGGFFFSTAACVSTGEGRLEVGTSVPKWLGFARDYRKRSNLSAIRAWCSVFFLSFVLGIFVCAGIALLCDKQLSDQLAIQRLVFGLAPPNENLFLADSLEPLVIRLEELQAFLDTHPDLSSDRRTRILVCRDRLDGFVNAILESSDWAELTDIPDMPSLREVAKSLESWSAPKIGSSSIPLVKKAEAKRRKIMEAWERARDVFPALEGRLAVAARLLNQEIRGPQAWRSWVRNCEDFCELDPPMNWEDPVWLLEEFIQARQSLQAQIVTISGAVQLASGLGLLERPEDGPGQFFPTANKGESFAKVPGIRELVFKTAGKDAGVFFSKLGPALGDSLKSRSGECRNKWLAIGWNELEADLGKGVISRGALQAWAGKSRKNPVMEGYGDWLQWLGEFEFRQGANSQKIPTRNPILQVERFVSQDSVPFRPARFRLTLAKGETDVDRDLLLELTVLGGDSRKVISSEGIKIGPGQWDFQFLDEDREKSGIDWGWRDSLRLAVKEKDDGKQIVEIIAENPACAWKFFGGRSIGLDWDLGAGGFPFPELLLVGKLKR